MYRFDYEVVFRDVDLFGHVNNAVVCSLLETARFKFFKDRFAGFNAAFVIARAEVDYLLPIFLGEVVAVSLWVDRIGRTSWDFRYTIDRGDPPATAVRAVTTQVWYDFAAKRKAAIPAPVAEVLRREGEQPAGGR